MSTFNEPKKRKGRPPIESEQLRSRAHIETVHAVDKWAETHGVTRAEAIRRLIQKGLEASDSDKAK